MQGVCIDPGPSNILEKGRQYYLFDHGINNFYVSNFNSARSHMGSFQKSYFKLVEQEKPIKEKPLRYLARVNRWRNGYAMGDEYIITERDHNSYFHVYLKDRADRGPIGSYLTDFLEIIEPYAEPEITIPQENAQAVVCALIDPAVTIIPEDPTRQENEAQDVPRAEIVNITIKKSKPKKVKAKKLTGMEKLEAAGQMNIFDILEG